MGPGPDLSGAARGFIAAGAGLVSEPGFPGQPGVSARAMDHGFGAFSADGEDLSRGVAAELERNRVGPRPGPSSGALAARDNFFGGAPLRAQHRHCRLVYPILPPLPPMYGVLVAPG